MDDLPLKIIKIKEEIRERDRLILKLNGLKYQMGMEIGKLNDLKKIAAKEEKDVKRLDSISIGNLIYSLLGNKKEKYEKENEEYILAKAKADECENTISSLERQICEIREQLDKYKDIDFRYEEIIKEREKAIINGSSAEKTKLMELSEFIADKMADLKEIGEAIMAGNNLLDILENMIESLRKAKNWGTVDMLGGGFISTSIKHSRIDEARGYVYEVKDYIGRFKRELKDIGKGTNLYINIGEFTSFADFFFDSFFIDWYVQNSIEEALENSIKLQSNVRLTVEMLEIEKDKVNGQIEELKRKYQSIIEGN